MNDLKACWEMEDILKKFRTRYVLVKSYSEIINPLKIIEDIMEAIKELMGYYAIFRIEIKLIVLNKKGFLLLRFRYYDLDPRFLYLVTTYIKKFGPELVPLKMFGTIKSARSALEFL